MKYVGKQKWSQDKDVYVYNFFFGLHELRVFRLAIRDMFDRLPKILETQQLRMRHKSFLKEMEKFQREEGVDLN